MCTAYRYMCVCVCATVRLTRRTRDGSRADVSARSARTAVITGRCASAACRRTALRLIARHTPDSRGKNPRKQESQVKRFDVRVKFVSLTHESARVAPKKSKIITSRIGRTEWRRTPLPRTNVRGYRISCEGDQLKSGEGRKNPQSTTRR